MVCAHALDGLQHGVAGLEQVDGVFRDVVQAAEVDGGGGEAGLLSVADDGLVVVSVGLLACSRSRSRRQERCGKY